MAMPKSGTQRPSLSPLSTLRPWRTSDGRLGRVTTDWPSAASVGASTIARISASGHSSDPNTTRAAPNPAAIVSGSPIPRSRVGTRYSSRRARRSMRAASPNSTTASVADASSLTVAPFGLGSTSPVAFAPPTRPMAVKTIGAVIEVPSNRRDTAANASTLTAIAGRNHSTPPRPRPLSGQAGDAVAQKHQGEQDDDHGGDLAQVPFEPGAYGLEQTLGSLSRGQQQDERNSEGKQRDEREDEPLNRVPGGRRVRFGDRLQRDRDEATGIRERRSGCHHRYPRRVGDRAHLVDHALRRLLGERPAPGSGDVD